MAKNRLNLSISDEKMEFLSAIAHGRNKQVGTIARNILEDALESYEDKLWYEFALERESTATEFITHEEAWATLKDK